MENSLEVSRVGTSKQSATSTYCVQQGYFSFSLLHASYQSVVPKLSGPFAHQTDKDLLQLNDV